MLKFFIGYDSREPIAYHVLAHSILRQASAPVEIVPLMQPTLRALRLYERDDVWGTTEFSLTRFLVPYLCDYQGLAVFMDCDMLCLRDPAELIPESDFTVAVCQHDYTPKTTTKFLGQPQAVYPRKNWSSVMVFNNERCKALSLEYVNEATPADLHRFAWVPDAEIKALPLDYNWLVGEYEPNPKAKILHYTLGGPWFNNQCDHAEEWFAEFDAMMRPAIVGIAGRPRRAR